jgi:hypothetical protein
VHAHWATIFLLSGHPPIVVQAHDQATLLFSFFDGLVELRKVPMPGMRTATAIRRRAMAPPRGMKLLIFCS